MSTPTHLEPEIPEVPEGYMKGKNGGLLMRGNPSGRGGGRPSNETRNISRWLFGKCQDKLITFLNDDKLTPDQLRMLMDTAGKYGLGEAKLAADEFAVLAGECFAELVPDSELVKQFASNLAERLKLGG